MKSAAIKPFLVSFVVLCVGVGGAVMNTASAIKAPPRSKPNDTENSVPQLGTEGQDGQASGKKKSLKIDYSASVAFASEYVFRGLSLSDEDFAVQGSLNAKTPGGYYLGVFASNVDFNDGDRTNAEVDYYTGMLGKITDSLGYNLDFTYSTFQGAPDRFDFDNIEVGGFLDYTVGRYLIHGGIAYSPDFFRNSGYSIYYDMNLDISLVQDFTLKLHTGFQELEKNDKFGTDDYLDWLIGIQKDYRGFNASISYTDTNLNREECFGGNDICDDRFVFLIGRGL